jgi:hypothetical protein
MMQELTTLECVHIEHEIDETLAAIGGIVTKSKVDHFHPVDAEMGLRSQLYDAWDARLKIAFYRAAALAHALGPNPSKESIPHFLDIFHRYLSGPALTSKISPATELRAGFVRGKASAVAHIGKSAKHRSWIRKGADQFFGLILGLTEDHAISALDEQMILSAGGFYDGTMTDVVRTELELWFGGDLTRDELIGNLKSMVNQRLASSGQESLPKSYFDGLAEHFIVRARNFGGIYQADKLGATRYKIQGILDHRTSAICRPLITEGKTFELSGAKDQMQSILRTTDLATLKQNHPFLTKPEDAVTPIPPLHWRCRSWMEYIV